MNQPRVAPPPQRASAGRFDIGPQAGGTINNVGGDQYFAARASFLRDVAATRTKARVLVWSGVTIFVVGFAVFAAGVLGFIGKLARSMDDGSMPTASPFGVEVFGVPSGIIGWAMAAGGVLLIVLGIVLHVVATARRRRVDTNYPLPGRGRAGY